MYQAIFALVLLILAALAVRIFFWNWIEPILAAVAPWVRYLYFLRFSILLWVFPLLLVWANTTGARSLISGIVTPARQAQYLCAAFFLFSTSCIALILARIVVVNGEERFGDACPKLLLLLLADESARLEWIAPVAAQLNNLIVLWYFLTNGCREGVDDTRISIGFGEGCLFAFFFWYVVGAIYYLTYRAAPGARMEAHIGRPAARTLLYPRSWLFLSTQQGQNRWGDALETAECRISFGWLRLFFPVAGYCSPPAGDLYEGHYFSILAACGFYALYWTLWPVTAPTPAPCWAWVFMTLYLLLGVALAAFIISAKPAPGTAVALRIWKVILAVATLSVGILIPYLYISEDAERFPTFALLLILVITVAWTLGAVAFFVDRYRIPVLTAVILSVAIPRMIGFYSGREEHYLSVSKQPTQVNLPTPDQLLKSRLALNSNLPLIVVTSTGGGIHAAAWTAAVLEHLETVFAQDPELQSFHQHVLLLSTVSGGSAGLYAYLREIDPKANGGKNDWDRMTAAAGCSSLEAIGWGLVYYDIPRAFAPFGPYLWPQSTGMGDLFSLPIGKDRTWALRRAFARNLSDPFCKLENDSDQFVPLAALRNAEQSSRAEQQELMVSNLVTADGQFPAFSMNTTTIENGERFLLANYKIPDQGPETTGPNYKARSFLATFHESDGSASWFDLPLATAAQMSATFPYVSSQARVPLSLDNSPQSVHFADGGYYDNDGTASAIEFLRYALGSPETTPGPAAADTQSSHLAKSAADKTGPLRILLVEIRNSGGIAGSYSESTPDHVKGNTLWGLSDQVWGPILGFWQAGHESITAREQAGLELLEHAYSGKLIIQSVVLADTWAADVAGTDPLNWSLTPGQSAEVRNSAARPQMLTRYSCAHGWFSAPEDVWRNPDNPEAKQLKATCQDQ
jgi:hypothetical protein